MKVSFLFDQGSAEHREDGMFVFEPFFGVLDGVSAPYGPKYPPRMFNRMTGGELVRDTVEHGAHLLSQDERSLPDFVRDVDALVAGAQSGYQVPKDAGELAGATFAFAKVGDEEEQQIIEIVQGGDCFVLWKMKDGTVGITPNQVKAHDMAMHAEIGRLMGEVAQELYGIAPKDTTPAQLKLVRDEMWNRFHPIQKEARRKNANNPDSPAAYALLNGQLNMGMTFQMSLWRDEVEILLLFSDGMVPWNAMKGKTDQEVAQQVLADYKTGGLARLLQVARGHEARVANVNYTDAAEATAIALEF